MLYHSYTGLGGVVDGGYLVRIAICLGVVEMLDLSEYLVFVCVDGWWI